LAAADQWDLAATFGKVVAATDAAAKTLDAAQEARVAVDLFTALEKQFQFSCSD
jgi:hypothetical protein